VSKTAATTHKLSRPGLILALLTGVVCMFAAPLARSQEVTDQLAERLFRQKPLNGKLFACFKRAYDPFHLGQHPNQRVRAIRLLISTEMEDDARTYALRIGVNFRNQHAPFETEGSCGTAKADGDDDNSPKAVHCAVDCDGGSIDVSLRESDAVMISIPDGARLWRPGASDTPEQSGPKFGSDDRLFRLSRTDLQDCLNLAPDTSGRAALRAQSKRLKVH
jgi:hypothetical protein